MISELRMHPRVSDSTTWRGHLAEERWRNACGWLAAISLVVAPAPLLAGPNAGGTLILAVSPELGTLDLLDCDQTKAVIALSRCEDAVTQYPPSILRMIAVFAAFPDGSSPRLSGTTFGVNYDPSSISITSFTPCGDFELPTGDWPGPNSGTAVTWGASQTDALVLVYAMTAAEYYGNDVSLDLIPHPTQGGLFADDDVPSNTDPVADYGKLGFNDNPGYLPCPSSAPGACCFSDGSCLILQESECTDQGGTFQGSGVGCDVCEGPAVGACCFEAACSILTRDECAATGGNYLGDDTSCDPNPCVTPTLQSSWGLIKDLYR